MQVDYLRRTAAQAFFAGWVTVFAVGPVAADKPEWAGGGGGKPEKHDKDRRANQDRRDEPRGHDDRYGNDRDDRRGDRDGPRADDRHGGERDGVRHGTVRFDDHHRTVIREHYTREFRAGHCPPGLAKKGTGCMPPGQAKKWHVGRPLPRDVVFYDLPPAIVVELGVPPVGHRFVRVASDILLIAIGTGMVIDAIEDLDRM